MGFFEDLVNRVRGRTSELVRPTPNPPSPSTLQQRLQSPQELLRSISGTGWTPVSSSNVAAVKWMPGTIVRGRLDPSNKAKEGPMGGAPVLGDIRLDVGMGTGDVSVAAMQEGEVTDDTLGTLYVRFRASGTRSMSQYEYYSVPFRVYHEFIQATSRGRFVWQRLRGKYAYRRTS